VAKAVQMRQQDRFQSVDELRAALLPAPPAQVIVPAPAAAPARPAPASAAPAPAPGRPAPAPAAPQARQAPTAAIPAPAAPAPARRGRGCLLFTGLLLLILTVGAAAYLALGSGLFPAPQAAPSASAQVLVARPFVARDIEIVVPVGTGEAAVNQAFLQLARLDCGCEPQIEPGTLLYLFEAAPRQLSIGADGARYRASLQATILVPQP
jgi:hypothetical protein